MQKKIITQMWIIEEENGYLLQYFCLNYFKDRGAWQDTVHGIAKSQTQLSN